MPPKKNKNKKPAAAAPAAEAKVTAESKAVAKVEAPKEAAKPSKKDVEADKKLFEGGNLKEKGNKAFAAEDFELALKFFSKAIEEDEKNHILYSNRAATYIALRNWKQAVADADMAIQLAPTWPKGYLRKGNALEGALEYIEARHAYRAGLAKDPKDAPLVAAEAEVTKLLDELGMVEVKESLDQDGDKFDGMVKWLKEGGAQFPKLYMRYYTEDYRGVHALARIPIDDTVLYVPLKYIMTSEVAKASDICKRILAAGVDIRSKHSYLACYLLEQRALGKKSFWEPYLRILPVKYANMPVFFDEPTLAMLKGSMSLQKISDRIDSLRREYENIKRGVPDFARFTLEDFIWGRFVVITRIFGLVIEGNKTDGLVPYADMLNHKKPSSETGSGKEDEADTKWTYEDSRHGFIITSTRPIARGDQIYDSYGRKCNSRFFVNYGFTVEDNEDNEAMIRVGLPATDPQFAMKLRFLGGREHSARREFQIPGAYGHKKVKELFSFMRFINAVDSEIMLLSAGQGFKLDEIGPISIRNELKVIADIKKACQESLAAFPESLEHDKKLLASGELKMYSNERNAVVMRYGEKVVLQYFVDLCDKATPLLKMTWPELKRAAQKAYGGKGTFEYYVTSTVVPLVKDKK